MTTHLVTFSDASMDRSARLCVESAQRNGVDYAVRCEPAEKSTERGYGFWKWKPRIILSMLESKDPFSPELQDGDIVIYSDAGVEFINNVSHIIERMDQDIFLFGNQWEHAHWCKRDIVDEINPLQQHFNRIHHAGLIHTYGVDNLTDDESAWRGYSKQCQASVIFFRVSDYTRKFVKEWLDWCLFEGGRLIDDSPSRTPNHPEFQENRHDQAILTTLAYREGIKLHWWPAQYNDGAFQYPRAGYERDDYPCLFNHHRRRNSEWEQAA